jgi:hypothetical protein
MQIGQMNCERNKKTVFILNYVHKNALYEQFLVPLHRVFAKRVASPGCTSAKSELSAFGLHWPCTYR